MIIDPSDYPNITWRWRIFAEGSFLCYLEARFSELANLTGTFKCVIDLQHRAVDLL